MAQGIKAMSGSKERIDNKIDGLGIKRGTRRVGGIEKIKSKSGYHHEDERNIRKGTETSCVPKAGEDGKQKGQRG